MQTRSELITQLWDIHQRFTGSHEDSFHLSDNTELAILEECIRKLEKRLSVGIAKEVYEFSQGVISASELTNRIRCIDQL